MPTVIDPNSISSPTIKADTITNQAGTGSPAFTFAPTFPDGSAAAPSVSFTSDTDVGLFRRAANELGISTAGAETAFCGASGGWTFGRSTGGFALTHEFVSGANTALRLRAGTTSNTANLQFHNSSSTRFFFSYSGTLDELRLSSASVTALNVTQSGSVTLGPSGFSGTHAIEGGLNRPTGFGNTGSRPALVAGTAAYEIRAISSAGASADDGYLLLSAGGGTNASTKSFIALTGFSTVADMNQNIVFGTNGVERLRIDPSTSLFTSEFRQRRYPTTFQYGIFMTETSGVIPFNGAFNMTLTGDTVGFVGQIFVACYREGNGTIITNRTYFLASAPILATGITQLGTDINGSASGCSFTASITGALGNMRPTLTLTNTSGGNALFIVHFVGGKTTA